MDYKERAKMLIDRNEDENAARLVYGTLMNLMPEAERNIFSMRQTIIEDVMDIDDPKTLVCIWAWIMKNKALNEWDK